MEGRRTTESGEEEPPLPALLLLLILSPAFPARFWFARRIPRYSDVQRPFPDLPLVVSARAPLCALT